MNFPGKFIDAILPDQIHHLNVSFFIDKLEEKLGGNAGNIAYSLSLLGERSIIAGSAGKDFGPYQAELEQRGLSLEGITVFQDQLTASAYITTDMVNNQITAFHAAAMMLPCEYTFPHLNPAEDIALIGPTNPDDMRRHPRLYRESGVRYIYDPGQQIPVLSGDDLREAISGAWLLVGNDYEIQLIMSKTGLTKADILGMTSQGLITTLGEQGSLVSCAGEELHVPAVPVSQVKDPTGAGDAYRAGIIKGAVLGLPMVEGARMGATCAAFCIEEQGTQGHSFSLDVFIQRHSAAFGKPL